MISLQMVSTWQQPDCKTTSSSKFAFDPHRHSEQARLGPQHVFCVVTSCALLAGHRHWLACRTKSHPIHINVDVPSLECQKQKIVFGSRLHVMDPHQDWTVDLMCILAK